MKKLLIIILSLISSCNMAFSQWSGLAENQWVSDTSLRNAITTGVFYQLDSSPSMPNNEWVYKSQIPEWIYIDNTNSYFTSKQSNQWVAKRDLIPLTPLVCGGRDTVSCIFCRGSSAPYTNAVIGYLNAGVTNGTFTAVCDTILTTGVTANPKGILSFVYGGVYLGGFPTYENTNQTVSFTYTYNAAKGNVIQVVATGDSSYSHYGWGYSIVTTCPVVSYPILQNGSGATFATSALACASQTGGPTIYMDIGTLELNFTHLYTNSNLTSPISTAGSWINVTYNGVRKSVQTDATGLVTSIVSC